MRQLRVAEWINLLAFSSYAVLGWVRGPLDPKRRKKITAIAATGLAITLFTALVLPAMVPMLAASVCRDWVPYLLLLMFYWQAGQFVTRTDAGFEARLERLDQRIVVPLLEGWARRPGGAGILACLEFAYLFCYASMPLGLAALYMMRRGREADYFWAAVLPAAYVCYGMLAFLQTRPPRRIGEKWSATLPSGKIRALNLWILRHASIQANTFPRVGLVFLAVAISIALGAVAGRYHYAADAILAALLAAAVFGVETALAPMGAP
jgi:hypothetical protein